MSSAAQVLKIARAEIGVKESPYGSNKQKYGKEYGMNGVAWCAEFVWWVFKHAGCPELFYGGKKSAYCPSIADYYISKRQTVQKTSAKPGDIVLFGFGHTNSQHIGIVEKYNKSTGVYTCIEGNTGIGNNANGGMVMRRSRYASQINWIVRPKYTEGNVTVSNKELYTLDVDGDWGHDTTVTTQHILKCTEDGDLGPKTVRAIQKKVGMPSSEIDGDWGKNTSIAVSKFLGIKEQKSRNKTLTKAWQKWCNKQL